MRNGLEMLRKISVLIVGPLIWGVARLLSTYTMGF